MKKLTKKHIFKQKLKGEPIYIYANRITNEEIQCLIECGIVEQFAKSPRRLGDLAIVLALYPIINAIPRRDNQYEFRDVPPNTGKHRSIVNLRRKSLINKGL